MLMTKYIYFVHQGDNGYFHIIITRLSDGVQKYFFTCNGSKAGHEKFLSSMTDELTEGYFPKPGKRGLGVDNWAFLGINPDRAIAENLARTAFVNLSQRV